ncbi:hypothetical protein Q644_18720 [Brucella intermedia 229E]|uniref:Uncharacterized protein n=1 Tax=Brucella intermedia 229E TaxID=1337887 RepID=U4VGY7_9HYPH|nr:hypothetical protein Q644_18720 [Brucella intermedia 229E]
MAGAVAARVLTDFSEIARLWKDAEAVHGAPPQSLEWIDNWRAIVNADSFVVGLFHGTEPILLVPLEAVSHRGGKNCALSRRKPRQLQFSLAQQGI